MAELCRTTINTVGTVVAGTYLQVSSPFSLYADGNCLPVINSAAPV